MKNGGPAFPYLHDTAQQPRFVVDPQTGRAIPTTDSSPGMTLRDWFAGQILTGVISLGISKELVVEAGQSIPQMRSNVARGCYEWADAMLAEREKETK